MKSILFFVKDPPYVLTILVALLAYQANNMINYYTQAPTLAYCFDTESIEKKGDKYHKVMSCELMNINNQKALRDVKISMRYSSKTPGKHSLYDLQIIAVAPSMIVPDTLIEENDRVQKNIKFDIEVVHPRSKYILRFQSESDTSEKLYPKLYLRTKDNILLAEESLGIYLAKNQFCVNLIFLLIWGLGLLFYLKFWPKSAIDQPE